MQRYASVISGFISLKWKPSQLSISYFKNAITLEKSSFLVEVKDSVCLTIQG